MTSIERMTCMHAYRSHKCADLRSSDVGSTVRLSGWIHRKRDHGGVLFVDLRDHYGLTQIVAAAGSDMLKQLEHLRSERLPYRRQLARHVGSAVVLVPLIAWTVGSFLIRGAIGVAQPRLSPPVWARWWL